jgi:putative two-component system response regulator
VDSDVVNCAISRDALARQHEVFALSNVHKLGSLLEKLTPDLILFDYEALCAENFTTLKMLQLTRGWQEIPVMLLLGEHDSAESAQSRILQAGAKAAQGFAPKIPEQLPFWTSRLLGELNQHQEDSQLICRLQEQLRQKNTQVFELQNTVFVGMIGIVDFRDDATGRHIERTRIYLEFLVDKLEEKGLYAEERCNWDTETLIASAALHDIGKVAIPDSILFKPGKLTAEEFAVMQTHVEIGVKLIEQMEMSATECPFLSYAKTIAATHHERWDGTGYPYGLRGEAIALEGRLMAIADVYDAIVSKRVYKESQSPEMAERIISKGAGTHFDPVLVEVFREIAPLFAKTARRLSDYEQAGRKEVA